jgi:Ala-tRNA(Pro) deacylase
MPQSPGECNRADRPVAGAARLSDRIGAGALRAGPPRPRMPATREDLQRFLDELGVATQTVEHPAVFTVAESRACREGQPGGHTKNLFLSDRKGGLFLLCALEDARVDLKTLHQALGAKGRLSFGAPALLFEVLGVAPGSVTPFGALNDRQGRVKVALDAPMLALERLNFHPLINTATTNILALDLLRFLRATGHPPVVGRFST